MPGRDTNIGAKRAREARAALGLHPAAPLRDVLAVTEERAGVPVVVARLPEPIAGCCWREGQRALLWVNGDQAVVRQRFTVAHELGHIRCAHAGRLSVDSVDVLAGRTRDPREAQANAFAAELLAPRAGVEAFVDREPGVEDVARLAAYFGISARAALYRLNTLRLTTRFERLRAEIEDERVRAYLEVPQPDDPLAALGELPRVPRALEGSALAAALRGEVSVDAAAGAAGTGARTLADALQTISR